MSELREAMDRARADLGGGGATDPPGERAAGGEEPAEDSRSPVVEHRPELGVHDRRLAIAALLPPVAFLLQQGFGQALAGWMCAAQTRWPLHAMTAGALGVALLCGAFCWRRRSETAARTAMRPQSAGVAARHALAWTGVVLATFFALLILALEVPGVLLEPCS
jgi:hypothetical protein